MLLAALWFSEEKPVMSTLLGPLMEEMNELFHNGSTENSVYYIQINVHSITYTCSTCKLNGYNFKSNLRQLAIFFVSVYVFIVCF